MGNRINLDSKLRAIAKLHSGSENVYFQPTNNVRMKYPAIRYSRNVIENHFADDSVYLQNTTYTVIVIDKDPDSQIVADVSRLPKCRHSRHYVADGLNHDVFTIYD